MSDSVKYPSVTIDQSPLDPLVCDEHPQRLGSGSFASVYMLRGGTVAFKEAHRNEDGATLQAEFEFLGRLYMACNTDTLFLLPRPYAFCQPKNPASYRTVLSVPSQKQKQRRRPEHPVVSYDIFELFEHPVYAMSRVFALPLEVARALRKCFFPPALQSSTTTLCRLYFGKVFPQRTNRFFNSFNFPLDVTRYEELCSSFTPEQRDLMCLPSTSEIATGMGEMLGRLHIRGGCDARDIEFVLGGSGGSDVSFFVIDFNQTRVWHKTEEGIPGLVQAFFSNDPYYPRPRQTDNLYIVFKEAYLQEYPKDSIGLGQQFITLIEEEQAHRDAVSPH